MPHQRANWYFYSSLICAVWFATSSWAWAYLANVYISFPFAVLSFILWQVGKKIDPNPQKYLAIKALLLMGIMSAIVVGLILVATN